jgi:leucyl aminopeptidase
MSLLHPDVLSADADGALPVRIVSRDAPLDGVRAAWARAHDFSGKAGQLLLLPGEGGAPAGALFGAGERFDPMSARALAA